MLRKLKQKILKIFLYESWNIGFAEWNENDHFQDIENKKFTWLPKKYFWHYYADPFFIKQGKNNLLFVEDYNSISRKGRISLLLLDNNFRIIKKYFNIIKSKFHLSYPQIIKKGNNFFMLPECCRSEKLTLYKSENFPVKWQKEKDILAEKAIDATILKHNNLYWLFYMKGAYELHINYSDNLHGEWQPHPKNPVKTGLESARPAGNFFTKNNKLYRPAQNCSKTYGGSIVINHITKLTVKDFEEEQVKEIFPNFTNIYNKGIHTINFNDGLCIIDAKIYKFTLLKPLISILRVFYRLFK